MTSRSWVLTNSLDTWWRKCRRTLRDTVVMPRPAGRRRRGGCVSLSSCGTMISPTGVALHAGGERFGGFGDPGDLGAVGGGGDHERRQASINPDPAAGVVAGAGRVMLGGVQVGGFDVQRDPPAPGVVGDGGEQDLRPAACEHAPQPACVVVHPDWPIPGRVTDRGRSLSPMRMAGGAPLGCLLRSRNDGIAPVFFLNRGNPIRLPLRLPERESDHAFRPLPQSTAASSNTC